MLIAQFSDLHIDGADERNAQRLAQLITQIRAREPAPRLWLLTGDLT